MDLPEIKFATVPQFLERICAYPNIGWVYRGESDMLRDIVPKAGRPKYYLAETEVSEADGFGPRDIRRFRQWRKLAVAYDQNLPENDFDCLAYAQHYGLATRFLDWSTNPLVALFFAVDSCSASDGAVYCYSPSLHLDSEAATIGFVPEIALFTPPPFDQRILLQSGVLTYMPNPSIALSPSPVRDLYGFTPEHGMDLVRFVVPAKMKAILKGTLDEIGVNRKSLFPDTEGLSNYVNWQTEHISRRSVSHDIAE